MPNLGAPELIIILLLAVFLFGSKKLPDLAKSVGSSMKELRKGMSDDSDRKISSAKDSTEKSA